jgi:hypothetical protein
MTQEKEVLTFHNEDAISRISLWSNIIAYTILAFATISFIHQIYQLASNWSQIVPSLPPNIFERIAVFVTNVFTDPLRGVFYFLVLRGISQLLNLGLDLFYAGAEEVDEVDIVEVATEQEI